MGKRPEVGFDPAVPRSRRPQQILRIVLGGKILVAQFRVGGKKFFKRAAFRGFHKSRRDQDRKSTRLNSSHGYISYAVFCLKKKKIYTASQPTATQAASDTARDCH